MDKDLKREVTNLFKVYGNVIVEALRQSLAQNKKAATGKLSKSLRFRIYTEKDLIELEVIGEDFFKILEKGRAPGKMPPIAELIKWIRAKKIQPKGIISKEVTNKKGQRVFRRRNVKQSEIRTAFAIAKSISKKGQKGTPIAAPIVKVVGVEISAELDKSFSDFVQGSITGELEKIPSQQITIKLY